MSNFNESVISAIRNTIKSEKEFVPLHEPIFSGNEWAYLKDCLDTGWVSSVGKYVDKFETDLADFTGSHRAIAVANGTAALHICLLLAGVQRDDEVICPSLTFIATANAIAYSNASPHFVDSEMSTLGMSPEKLEEHLKDITVIRNEECFNKKTNRRIKALVVMHTFGHPTDIDPIHEICNRYHITFIEDAAESLGSYYKGRHTGNDGQTASLSFNGNKTITTGGGGAIITNNPELGKLAKHLTTTAKVPHKWAFIHDAIGYNYRMPNLNAALGCAQLENLPKFLETKRKLASLYEASFSNLEGITFFKEPSFAKSNYWLNALIIDEALSGERDSLLTATNDSGLMTRPAWTLMHKLDMFKDCPKSDLSIAESIEARLINIPSSANLI